MSVPNPDYRLNPSRAIRISGVIDESLVARVTPQIFKLQSVSREPITVYIDSRGGDVECMKALLGLFKLSDQDEAKPCRILTVVTSMAASAAADLLSSGDYAIAFPHGKIVYHGTRTTEKIPLTVESTTDLTSYLRRTDDEYASNMIYAISGRYFFRYLNSKPKFEQVRAQSTEVMSDLQCFIKYIENNLTIDAKNVIHRAKKRFNLYGKLLQEVLKRKGNINRKEDTLKDEADHLKAIVDFEAKENEESTSWKFSSGGIESLVKDYYIWTEYVGMYKNSKLWALASSYARYIIPTEEFIAIEAIKDEKTRETRVVEAIRLIYEPILPFLIAVCHILQEEEYELTARDAYWLGIVDEVYGEHLPTQRALVEFSADVNPKEQDPLPIA